MERAGLFAPESSVQQPVNPRPFRGRSREEALMFSWSGTTRISASADTSNNACLVGARSLVADSVYDANGNRVGTLEEIVIDTRTGCIRHAVVAVGGILGIGRRRLAVPWSALKPDANYHRCIVDVTEMALTAVPVSDDDPWLQRNYSPKASASYPRPTPMFGAKSI